ncbi:MAG: NifU family protein [Actinomycetota bacterium]|nr:NifU family protein [Actinomycetota bacterium]MDQ3732981.1 NifU family protein [Actinomycetota bacterium]
MGQPEETASPPSDDLRAVGERIEILLDASSSGGVVARERAEELVRLVADLYGAGLGRVLEVMYDLGRLDDEALAALADDELISSLLLVHGLHPYDVTTRVEKALESVRPYMATHGGDVELLEVTDDDVVRVRLLGSCDGCASSSVTLSLAVEGAIEAAAPEIVSIEVDTTATDAAQDNGPLISVDSLRSRLGAKAEPVAGAWEAAPLLTDLEVGQVGGFTLAGVALIGCRLGSDLFVFRDQCPRCTSSMAGASLERRLGYPVGDGVLRCPSCRSHYDVRLAGACLEAEGEHLAPLPLLVRDGVVSVAVPAVSR